MQLTDRELLLLLQKDVENAKKDIFDIEQKQAELAQYKIEIQAKVKVLLALATTIGSLLSTVFSKFLN